MTVSQEIQEPLVKNSNNVQSQEALELNPITVTADFGGIGTKAFVSYQKGKQRKTIPIVMGAELAVVKRDSILILEKENFGSSEPEHRAWCSIEQTTYKVIGSLAERYHGASLLKPSKYELAIFKALALLWVIKEKLNLPPNFVAHLAILIPPGEYNDRFELEKLLREASQKFYTPSGEMSVNIEAFQCKPESAGIVQYIQNVPKYNFFEQNISVVMIGYRNASLIALKHGQLFNKSSSDLGMSFMIQIFRDLTCKNNPLSELLPIMVEYAKTKEEKLLHRLIDTRLINNHDYQIQRLKQGLTSSKSEYFQALTNWIMESLPPDNNLILYCGGTAEYLREDICYFQRKTGLNLSIFDDIEVPEYLDKYSLKERIYDLYCYNRAFAKSLK